MSSSENTHTSLRLHDPTNPQIEQPHALQVVAGMPPQSSFGGWVFVQNGESGRFVAWGFNVAPALLVWSVLIIVLGWFLMIA
ncbi:unnamed protein product [Peniophora sp. CBMAI 1063]|nr:unnamed protein product [Peniophora sp. CBMAI 1063]